MAKTKKESVPQDEENAEWMHTRCVTATAEALGIPVYLLPRKPPNIPFALPNGEGEPAWLYPSHLSVVQHSEGPPPSPFQMNATMYRLSRRGAKAVLCEGPHAGNLLFELYFERGENWMVHYDKGWGHYHEYYGVPVGATVNDPDPVKRLNAIFFTERLLPHKPLVPDSPLAAPIQRAEKAAQKAEKAAQKEEGKKGKGYTRPSGLYVPKALGKS